MLLNPNNINAQKIDKNKQEVTEKLDTIVKQIDQNKHTHSEAVLFQLFDYAKKMDKKGLTPRSSSILYQDKRNLNEVLIDEVNKDK